jgi:hypothetical protein
VEGVDDHDLDLAVLKVVQAVEQISDDAIAGNHGVGEDSILVVLNLKVWILVQSMRTLDGSVNASRMIKYM